MKILIIYQTATGRQPFREWISSFRNQLTVARVRARLERVENGNLGDVRFLGGGIGEFRFDFGGGLRIYFGQADSRTLVLLNGGDKGTQNQDIELARTYWADYLRRC